jgi:hypothetical protein
MKIKIRKRIRSKIKRKRKTSHDALPRTLWRRHGAGAGNGGGVPQKKWTQG